MYFMGTFPSYQAVLEYFLFHLVATYIKKYNLVTYNIFHLWRTAYIRQYYHENNSYSIAFSKQKKHFMKD